jgi:DNA-binding NarL/FixJ family response regulator
MRLIVILDMIMPEMGGGETFDRLKEINPDIKVVLSSGYALNGQANKIMERGCRAFIQKTFTVMSLSQRVRDVLDISVKKCPLFSEVPYTEPLVPAGENTIPAGTSLQTVFDWSFI